MNYYVFGGVYRLLMGATMFYDNDNTLWIRSKLYGTKPIKYGFDEVRNFIFKYAIRDIK